MKAMASIDGNVTPLAEAKVSALDRGFLFGDSVYEVIRVYRGKPWLMSDHLDRLGRSLDAIRIQGIDIDRLRQRIEGMIGQHSFGEAIIYIQITRGAAPRAHKFPAGVAPLEFFYVQDFKDPYVEARQTGVGVVTHPELRWGRCDIKSTNLLGNVLAMQTAIDANCAEALFVHADGTILEGTHTSCFGVLNGTLLTFPSGPAILPGITRSLVLRLARRAQIPVQEHVLKMSDLARVTELFLTGTTSEIMPIVKVDGKAIADGQPGTVTRRLQEAYAHEVEDHLGA
ncbi:MAG: D-amino acid aminotransferase [Gemmataceae bacterium]